MVYCLTFSEFKFCFSHRPFGAPIFAPIFISYQAFKEKIEVEIQFGPPAVLGWRPNLLQNHFSDFHIFKHFRSGFNQFSKPDLAQKKRYSTKIQLVRSTTRLYGTLIANSTRVRQQPARDAIGLSADTPGLDLSEIYSPSCHLKPRSD
jgi:hypothetical protein